MFIKKSKLIRLIRESLKKIPDDTINDGLAVENDDGFIYTIDRVFKDESGNNNYELVRYDQNNNVIRVVVDEKQIKKFKR